MYITASMTGVAAWAFVGHPQNMTVVVNRPERRRYSFFLDADKNGICEALAVALHHYLRADNWHIARDVRTISLFKHS
jgi:hypothetical protein